MGQTDKAIEAYLEAIRLGPNYAEPQFGLGWSYFQLKEYEKALLPLKIAIKVEPKMVTAHFTLGKVLAALKKHDQAITHYKKALKKYGPNSNHLKVIKLMEQNNKLTFAKER